MTTLFWDTETFSSIPLKRGVHVYGSAPDAGIMVNAWAVDDGPVTVEDLTDPDDAGNVRYLRPSDEFLALLGDPTVEVVIHQSAFDRTMARLCWGIDLAVERVHDTMVRAMVHSLPGSLGKQCEIMGVPADEAKDTEGGKLIQLFCKPRPKNMKVRRATRLSHPDEWSRFLSYAGSDILAMRQLYARLPLWNYRNTNYHQELSLWHLDQRINSRGFKADVDLAKSAMVAISREQHRLKGETQRLTDGAVESASKRDQLLAHILAEYGVDLPDMKKDTLERRINDPELPDGVRQLLRLRLQTSTTSTAKYKSLLSAVCDDDRIRGGLQFAGALRTARWSGKLFQPHNLPRPDMLYGLEQAQKEGVPWASTIEFAIEAVMADCADMALDDVMAALRNMLRCLIIADDGRKIVAADLSNIEGRVAAWLSEEQWKLDKFAMLDANPKLPDMYCQSYAQAFGVTPEEVMANKKAGGDWRQVGKVNELAMGYEGGVAAWLAFAAVYRLELDELARRAYPLLPEAARTQAEIILQWRKKKRLTTFGLSDKTFVVIETFKQLWRKGHPNTATYWGELEEAAMDAVSYGGRIFEARKLAFERRGAWLCMILPSTRVLCYPAPKLEGTGRSRKLTYAGVNQYNRRWGRIATYGGKLFENACQATARDVMAYNMPAIENAGYPIVLTVHDEVITEPLDDPAFTSDALSTLLATNPPWLEGCPLAAGGFEAQRYRKD